MNNGVKEMLQKKGSVEAKSKAYKPWVAEGPKTLLKLKDLHPLPCFDGVVIVIVPSSI